MENENLKTRLNNLSDEELRLRLGLSDDAKLEERLNFIEKRIINAKNDSLIENLTIRKERLERLKSTKSED